jgi:hypothetical protein
MRYYRNPANAQVFGYDPETQQELIDTALAAGWVDITGSWPEAPSEQRLKDDCVQEAQFRLQATDYSQLADVSPRLANAAEFAAYRAQVRALLLNPVANPTWPMAPTAVWA